MKKGKLNNSGFVLMETLIVTVFVMSIFALLYSSFTPLIGEYEKREFYDDVDGKYAAYWIKKIIESGTFDVTRLDPMNIEDDGTIIACGKEGYLWADCEGNGDGFKITETLHQNLCKRLSVKNIYVTTYKLTDFKEKLKNGCDGPGTDDVFLSGFTGGMHKYVGYLPEFKYPPSPHGAMYRVIVEFERGYDKNGNNVINEDEDANGEIDDYEKSYMAYSTFEVVKW